MEVGDMRTVRFTLLAVAWVVVGGGSLRAQPSADDAAAERSRLREEIKLYEAEYAKHLHAGATGFEGTWLVEGSRTYRPGSGAPVIDEVKGEFTISLVEGGELRVRGEVVCANGKGWRGAGTVEGDVLKTELTKTAAAGGEGQAEYRIKSDGSLQVDWKGEVKRSGETWPCTGRAKAKPKLNLSQAQLEAKLFELNKALLALSYPRSEPPSFKSSSKKVEARFTPTPEYDPRGVEAWLIGLIDAAETSLDLCVFEFALPRVVNALERAKARGVEVRVVYDSRDEDEEAVAQLHASGIPAHDDDGRSNLMHNKFMVVDGKRVWTGSTNLSANALYWQDNNAILFESAALAREYTTEFEEMYVDHLFGGGSGNAEKARRRNTRWSGWTEDRTKLDDWVEVDAQTAVQVFFAPEDDAMARLVEEVRKAKKSIRFLAFAFTSKPLFEVLVERMKDPQSPVEVSGIFEANHVSWADIKVGPLHAAGATVRLDKNPRPLHHKVVIIDDQVVCTGSFNFSEGADSSNDENLVIIRSKPLAATFVKEFEALMAITDPNDPRIATAGMPGSGGITSAVEGEEPEEEEDQ
jgi:phosphatidylserine/phosphatidylglycerophosphate/cardiolipin synthase-like enzyme